MAKKLLDFLISNNVPEIIFTSVYCNELDSILPTIFDAIKNRNAKPIQTIKKMLAEKCDPLIRNLLLFPSSLEKWFIPADLFLNGWKYNKWAEKYKKHPYVPFGDMWVLNSLEI